jgi:hypothetical protein
MAHIELIQTNTPICPLPEDWSVHVNGTCYGYLYRCDEPAGYAVGIGNPDREIKYFSIEDSKDEAIAYAEKHIGLLLESIDRNEV